MTEEEMKELLKEMQANCVKGMLKGAIYEDEKAERKAVAIELALNLIEKQQAEIEEYERILDIFNEREYRKKYLAERRKEEGKLFSPDADEVYKRYYEQQEEIEKKDNTIKSKDKEIKLLKEFHNKHIKIIDEMAEEIEERTGSCPFDTYEYEMENCKDCQDSYKKCWIEYFTNKVETKE